MLEAPKNLKLAQAVQVGSPIKGARGEVLLVLMNEDAAYLIIMIKELLLLLENALL
jgi:hypothetical protein